MKRFLAVCLLAMTFAMPASAQFRYMTTDHAMRSSQLIGMTVFNEHNESIGTIDDIMIPANGGPPVAVISVGGFLGIGSKLVKVPLSHVHFMAENAMMAGGSKAALMKMPAYSYVQHGGGG
jgi:sporulation protein YlmC with PRC-barrel domain